MDITHTVKKTVILGINGSGKTYMAKTGYLDKEKHHLIIDPMQEYGGYKNYHTRPAESLEKLQEELAIVIKKIVNVNAPKMEEKRKVKNPLKLFVIDEADLFIPAKKNMPFAVHRLIVECRHRNLNLLFISRRPTDLNAHLMDLADELIIFKQTGVNAIKRLDALAAGLGQAAHDLDYDKHEYLIVNRQRDYQKITPK